ncbi:MAG: phosphopantetheine-binding protein [Myxococcota bacterium]
MERLLGVLAEALGIPRASLSPESEAGQVEGWDSMGTLQIVTAVQAAYSVELSLDDMAEMNDVPAVKRVLERLGHEIS